MKLQIALLPLGLALSLLGLFSCVNVDPQTGETIPRGNQKLYFEVVEKEAEKLQKGMTKWQVIELIGSPAEKSKDDDTWVYVPERPAVLVPARALKVRFENGVLVDHGYHAIVLGQAL